MAFAVVLDASVLYPLPLRDTLLRVAETELYDPLWSERILGEVARNLIADRRATEQQAERLIAAMRGAFDAAAVPEDAIARLEPAMTNDPGDRHVRAAAVASEAQAIVTLSLRHFPDDACVRFAVEPLHPDEFLLNLYGLDPEAVTEAVRRQASVLRRPPITFEQLLDLRGPPSRTSPRRWRRHTAPRRRGFVRPPAREALQEKPQGQDRGNRAVDGVARPCYRSTPEGVVDEHLTLTPATRPRR